MTTTYQDWMNALAAQESGGQPDDGYGFGYGGSNGYLGRYQMSEGALVDVGYVNNDGTLNNDYSGGWTGKDGVNSINDFTGTSLQSHAAQDRAFLQYTKQQWDWIRDNDLDSYVGTTMNGVPNTVSGMLAGAHLVGRGGLRDYLESGGTIIPEDGNSVPITDYLGEFQGYDTPFDDPPIPAHKPDIAGLTEEEYNALVPEAGGDDDDGETLEVIFMEEILEALDGAFAEASPLILDLDGDGIELTNLNSAGSVYWDVDNDGFAEASGWVGDDDGLLALDINEDGIINDHTELFGDQTGFGDGFAALASYDENNDGVIDSSDDVWTDLIIWQDANTNGYSEEGELHTMADFDILSIDLGATDVTQTIAGNSVTLSSSYTYDTGSGTATRTIVDAWFRYSDVNTVYNQDYALDALATVLPNLRGYGTVPTLQIAMSLDNDLTDSDSLISLVYAFDARDLSDLFDDANDPYGAVKDIMFRWAGVEDVDPDSRGANIDARELAFIEKLTGQPFLQLGSYANPGPFAALELQDAFELALDNFYARLTAQSAGGELFEGDWSYNIATDSIEGITGLDDDVIDDLATAATGSGDPALFWINAVRMIEYTVGIANLSGGDETALDDAIQNTVTGNDLQDIMDLLHEEIPFVTTNGTGGTDTLTGSGVNDIIYGGGDNDTLTGNAGIDTLRGEAGVDTLSGGTGSDLMIGGTGADIYHFEQNWGGDTIRDSGATSSESDKIVMGAGIVLGDLTFTRLSNYVLKIEIDDAGAADDFIIIENHFSTYYTSNAGIETIEFADTSTLDLSTISYTLTGTAAGESLWGVVGGGTTTDIIYGEGGNDYINGGDGNDGLHGGDGNDTVYGEAGNDTLNGDAGNDKLYGGADNDTVNGGAGDDINQRPCG